LGWTLGRKSVEGATISPSPQSRRGKIKYKEVGNLFWKTLLGNQRWKGGRGTTVWATPQLPTEEGSANLGSETASKTIGRARRT